MRETLSSDDINERKGSLILKHRDTGSLEITALW